MKNIGLYVCIVVIAVIITPVHALVIRRDQSVEIPVTEVIDDDLIAFGNTVDIKGTVTGNVCAFAQTVNVSGDIGGSLLIGAANANIRAKNVQTVWAMGGNINIAANVVRNLMLFGGSLNVNEDAQTGKDLRAYGGRLAVHGIVNGTIKGGVGTFLLAGKSGSIKIKADKTRIKSTAVILGDFHLTSKSKPEIDEGAIIEGEMSVREIEPDDSRPFFLAFAPLLAFFAAMIKIIVLISKVIVGILLIALCQKYVRRVMDTLTKETWKSLGWGFLGVIVVPVAAVVLFITLIGYPLGVLALYSYSILLYVSSIFIAVVVGEKIIKLFRKSEGVSLYFSFIIGMLILFVVSFIPILNILIRIFVVLFGFGATLLATWKLVKDMRNKELV